MHFALHVARLACPAVGQQPSDLAHRLTCSLIGDAVDRNDGDAMGCAHRGVRFTRPFEMASVSARILGALYRRDPRGSTTATEKERAGTKPDTPRRDVDARLPRHRVHDASWTPDVHRIPFW